MCYAAGRLNTDLAVHDINLSLSREKGVRSECLPNSGSGVLGVCW